MPELNPPPEPRDTPGGERRIGAAVAAVLAAGALYLWKSPAGREDELRPSTGVVSIPEPAATPATSLTPPEKGDEGAYEDGELTYPGLLSALQRAARTGEERKSVRRLQTYFKSHHHTDELVKEFERRAADGKKPKPKASEFLKRLGSVPGAAQGIESFLSSPGTGALVVRALAQPGVRDALRAAAGEPSSAPTPSPGRPSFSAGDLVLLKRVFPNVPIFDAMAGGARPSGGGWGPIEFPAGGGGKTGETGSPGAPSPSPSLVPVPPTGPTKVVGEYRPGREPQDPTNPTPSPSPIPGPSPTPTPTPAQRCGYDAIICGLYQKYLHRLPDDAGARYWQIRLAELRKAGVPQNQLENHLTAPFIGGIWEDELKKLDEKR